MPSRFTGMFSDPQKVIEGEGESGAVHGYIVSPVIVSFSVPR